MATGGAPQIRRMPRDAKLAEPQAGSCRQDHGRARRVALRPGNHGRRGRIVQVLRSRQVVERMNLVLRQPRRCGTCAAASTWIGCTCRSCFAGRRRYGTRIRPLPAPLQAVDERALPPMFTTLVEHDPLHADRTEHARQSALADVDVRIHEVSGQMHGHARALPHASVARDVLEAVCNWLPAGRLSDVAGQSRAASCPRSAIA